MKVKKIGYLNSQNEILGKIPTSLVMMLSKVSAPETPSTEIHILLTVGKGELARTIMLDIPVAKSVLSAQMMTPVSLNADASFTLQGEGGYSGVFVFKNQVFRIDSEFIDNTTEEEATLLIKKQVYSEDKRLKKLKQDVEAMERVINHTGSIEGTDIPEAVKLLVYERDSGKCVRCGSVEGLYFKHIISLARGGANSETNVQILCEFCDTQRLN